MKKLRIILFTVMSSFIWNFLIFQSAVYAQESRGESIDCTDVQVDYADDPTLTREERIHLMDKAFYKSLDKFELCQSAMKRTETNGHGAAAARTSGVSGGSGDSGDSSGDMEGTSASRSAASSTMSGTDSPKENSAAEDNIETEDSNASSTSRSADNENSMNRGNVSAANGKLPGDIPSADNDSALAAQIRHAAENETDPVKKAQLWNEYRKYRGLPQK